MKHTGTVNLHGLLEKLNDFSAERGWTQVDAIRFIVHTMLDNPSLLNFVNAERLPKTVFGENGRTATRSYSVDLTKEREKVLHDLAKSNSWYGAKHKYGKALKFIVRSALRNEEILQQVKAIN